MSDLIVCRSCARHIHSLEPCCPFCAATIDDTARFATPPVAPRGLSRARLYAFHAAVATGVAATACGAEPGLRVDAPTDAAQPDAAHADASGGSSIDSSGGVDGASPEAEASAAVDGPPDASGSVDPAWDASPILDATMADRGPIPLPYGSVFPCDDDGSVV